MDFTRSGELGMTAGGEPFATLLKRLQRALR